MNWISFIACLLLGHTAFGQFERINMPDGIKPAKSQVGADLIADIKSVQPGEPFRLGVRYRMQPQWHIYWHNWGDIGLATDIRWDLPEGWKVGPLQWPVPEKFTTGSGDSAITGYGYHGETVLFVEVTPPDTIIDQSIELKALTKWLACRESCIPGGESMSIRLPVGSGEPSYDRKYIDYFAERVPVFVPRSGPAGHITTNQLQIRIPGLDDIQFVSGKTSVLNLEVTPREGWKIADEAGRLDLQSGLYPHAVEGWENTHAGEALVENGKLMLSWPVIPSPGVADGRHELAGVLRVPLMKDGEPDLTEVMVQLSLTAQIGDVRAVVPSVPSVVVDPIGSIEGIKPGAGPEDIPRGFSFLEMKRHEQSVWYFLLLAFLGGIILNVMPCVLPVISIKILSFVRQANDNPARIFRMGLMFTLGILASFSVLALTVIGLRAAGTAVGWGFHLQNPIFVIIMSAAVLAFSLSLFGVFSINLSASVNQSIGSATQQEGYAGAFVNGVLATALSTPCVAPFLGPAVGYAFTKSGPVVLAFFLTTGSGLAFPYLLLSMNPGWLRWLPRPGNWMATFKGCMGLLLLATVVWLLFVVAGQVSRAGFWATIIFLVVVGLVAWLYGRGTDLRASRNFRRTTPWLVTAILALSFYFLPYRYISSHDKNLVNFGPQARIFVADEDVIPWVSFDIDAIEQMVRENKPIFIDFTADWCASCKYNEKTALDTGEVRATMEKYGVIPVKADWTRKDEVILKVLNQFGESGVPFYVLLPPGRADQPVILPKFLTKGIVLRELHNALGPDKVVSSRRVVGDT